MRYVFLFCCLLHLPVSAQEGPAHHFDEETRHEAGLKYFTDIPLTNQNGDVMRFYNDLIKDKVVVVNAFFTSCQGVCPALSNNLARVQAWLGDRLEKEVRLITISVDPGNDSVEKMSAYAARFEAREGWYFLSGSQENVEAVNRKLGHHVDHRENHTNIIVVGNETTGKWRKVMGLSGHEPIIEALKQVMGP